MVHRNKIISEICKRYKINAAMASETLSVVLENKIFKNLTELHRLLDYYERLGNKAIMP